MFPVLKFGPWSMPAYGLFSAAGFVGASLWLFTRRERMGLDEAGYWAAAWALVLGALLGAKLLFLALAWEEYASGRMSFWRDWRVGYVYFGGLAGAAAAGAVFARRRGLSFLRGADYFAVAIPAAHAVGRLGCLAAGCCHGAPTSLPWGVTYAHPLCAVPEAFRGLIVHPVQIYETAALVGLAWLAARVLRRVEAQTAPIGSAFAAYLGGYGAVRFVMDFFRGDGRAERFLGLSHQQGFALVCLAAGMLLATVRAYSREGASP